MAEPKFEKDLEKLENIVEALEEGGLSLDASLKKFEEGIQLAKRCEKALSSAEKKIEKLTRSTSGDLKTSPLDEEDPEPEPDPDVEEESSGAVTGGSDDDEDDEDEDDDDDDDDDEDELLF